MTPLRAKSVSFYDRGVRFGGLARTRDTTLRPEDENEIYAKSDRGEGVVAEKEREWRPK